MQKCIVAHEEYFKKKPKESKKNFSSLFPRNINSIPRTLDMLRTYIQNVRRAGSICSVEKYRISNDVCFIPAYHAKHALRFQLLDSVDYIISHLRARNSVQLRFRHSSLQNEDLCCDCNANHTSDSFHCVYELCHHSGKCCKCLKTFYSSFNESIRA